MFDVFFRGKSVINFLKIASGSTDENVLMFLSCIFVCHKYLVKLLRKIQVIQANLRNEVRERFKYFYFFLWNNCEENRYIRDHLNTRFFSGHELAVVYAMNLFSVTFNCLWRPRPAHTKASFYRLLCEWRFFIFFFFRVCDFWQIYMRAYLLLLISRWLSLNDSIVRIFFTQMMLFGLTMGFPYSPILKELLPIFTENLYHLLTSSGNVCFLSST